MKEGLLFVILVSFYLIILLLIRKKPFSYYYFIFNYLILTTGVLSYYAIFANVYQEFPHLSKIQSPLGYLNGPAGYFFVLFTLYPSRRPKWIDLLHLLPFLLHFIEMIPYFSLSAEEKRLLTNNFDLQTIWQTKHGSFLSFSQHAMLKASSIFVYTLFQVKLNLDFIKKSNKQLLKQNALLIKWVSAENTLRFFLMGGLIISIIIAKIDPTFSLNNMPPLIFSANLILSFSFMFLYPEILQGLKLVHLSFEQPLEQADTTQETLPSVSKKENEPSGDASWALQKIYFEKIEAYMQTTQPFLNEQFSRQIMAEEMSISLKRITESIHASTGLHFSDYVNTYRLHFVEQQIRTGSIKRKSFTIEAIAQEAGFGNRTSFHNAVKRMKNMTPSEYIQSIML